MLFLSAASDEMRPDVDLERTTGFEPATLTLARWPGLMV